MICGDLIPLCENAEDPGNMGGLTSAPATASELLAQHGRSPQAGVGSKGRGQVLGRQWHQRQATAPALAGGGSDASQSTAAPSLGHGNLSTQEEAASASTAVSDPQSTTSTGLLDAQSEQASSGWFSTLFR